MKRKVLTCSLITCGALALLVAAAFALSRSLAVAAAERSAAQLKEAGWTRTEVTFDPKFPRPLWVVRYAGPVEDDETHLYEGFFMIPAFDEPQMFFGPVPHVDRETGDWKLREEEPNKTPEHISEGRGRPSENAQR